MEVDVISTSEPLPLVLSSLAQLLRLNARKTIISTRKCNDFPFENIQSTMNLIKNKIYSMLKNINIKFFQKFNIL